MNKKIQVKIYKYHGIDPTIKKNNFINKKTCRKKFEQRLLVYRSETKTTCQFRQKLVQNANRLCNSNLQHLLFMELIEVQSGQKQKTLGILQFTIQELQSKNTFYFTYNNTQTQIQLIVKSLHYEDYFDFVDFLKFGLNLNFIVGIDFSASNLDYNDIESYHYLDPPNLNQYQQAILSVGEILHKYNIDNKIGAFGFGAKIGNPLKLSHFFPINQNYANPFVNDLTELFQCYYDSIQDMQFWGPTLLQPLLQKSIIYAQQLYDINISNYTILLILTDGGILDLQDSIDEIVKGSKTSISIIIVGIGNEKFEDMQILDADDNVLKSTDGNVMQRDIVQFVKFEKFKNNLTVLQHRVCEEIPTQVIEFYKTQNITPSMLQENIEKSKEKTKNEQKKQYKQLLQCKSCMKIKKKY